MITVFGSINIDLVTRVKALPRPGETVLADTYATLFGGKGANQAVAAARAAGRPGVVRVVGAVGDDSFGRDCTANLAASQIEPAIAIVPAPTGCAFIQVDALGENVITVATGANRLLAAAAMGPKPMATGSLLVLQMEVPLAESVAAATAARKAGAQVLTNLAPVPNDLSRAALRDLCAVTDMLIVNEHEAVSAATCLGCPQDDPIDAAIAVAKEGGCTVIVTLGAGGALAAQADGALVRVAAPVIAPVDTTGAGDTFVGVLATFLSEGLELRNAMALACRAASLACLSLGAQTSMPDRAAIMA